MNEPTNEIDRISKFDDSLSFGAEQKTLQLNFDLFSIFFVLSMINKEVYQCMSEHANARKHSCSPLRVL